MSLLGWGRAPRGVAASVGLLITGSLVWSLTAARPVDTRRPAPILAGAVHINEPDHGVYTQALRDAGLNAVQVTAYARQGAWDSAELTFDTDASGLRHELRAARRAGLKSMLVLRTDIEHALPENRHLWHGMIWPKGTELEGWFENYRDFVLWGAQVAIDEGVDVFAIGNELTSMTSTEFAGVLPEPLRFYLDPERSAAFRSSLEACEGSLDAAARKDVLQWPDGTHYTDLSAALVGQERAWRDWAKAISAGGNLAVLRRRGELLEDRWRQLIKEVRATYPGVVTYGATFDQVDRVGFWDALDAVGTTAYFPLALYDPDTAPQRSEVERAWSNVALQLEAVAAEAAPKGAPPTPIYLLELGWTRRVGSTVRPWSYERLELLTDRSGGSRCVVWGAQPERNLDRQRALQGLHTVVRRGEMPSLRGFSLWKVTTRDYHWDDESFAVLLPARDVFVEDADFLDSAAAIAETLAKLHPSAVRRE